MIRVVGISDTHTNEPKLPDGDWLVHTGDFTIHGYRVEAYRQFCWLEEQRSRYKHVFVTPGNHDFYIEKHLERVREELALIGVVLLHNDYLEVDGVRIYGSGHTPNYHDWAFMLNESAIYDAWEKIPPVDALFTHSPPYGVLDKSYRDEHIGCLNLLERVKKLKPKIHIFGHAHEGFGREFNGHTTFLNVAQKPQVYDLDLGK